jgi:hypothetical protein
LREEQVFFDAWLKNRSLDYELDGSRLFKEKVEEFNEVILPRWLEDCRKVDVLNQEYWFENDMLLTTAEMWELLKKAMAALEEILKSPPKKSFYVETDFLSIRRDSHSSPARMIVEIKSDLLNF